MFIAQCLTPSSLPVIRQPADAAVVGVLAGVVEQVAVAVEALDHLRADRRLLAQPDRRGEHEDVGGRSRARRSRASRRAPSRARSCPARRRWRCRGRSRGTARRSTPLRSMIAIERSARPCVCDVLRRALERAVDVDGAQVGEVPARRRAELLLLGGEGRSCGVGRATGRSVTAGRANPWSGRGGAGDPRGGGGGAGERERSVGAHAVRRDLAAGGGRPGADGVQEATRRVEVEVARRGHERGEAVRVQRRQRAVAADREAADAARRVAGVGEAPVRRDGDPARGALADRQRRGDRAQRAAEPSR